jgi:aminoglycoside phosphotransferase
LDNFAFVRALLKPPHSRLGLSDSSGLSEDKLQAERTRESNTLLWPQDVVPTVDDILSAETTIVKKDSRATLKRFGPSIIVKYGRFVHLAEVEALTFAASHTSIPVPSVLASYPAGDCHCIVMQNIPGVPLSQAWDSLSSGDRVVIQRELRGYIQDLRHVMAERWIGSVGKTPCRDLIFRCYLEGNKGPFSSEFDFNSAIVDTLDLLGDFPVDKQLLRQTFTRRQPHRIVFTHGDINPDNIMIHNGHVSGIIDWEQAGFYPEYWEYCKTLVSSRLNKDWSLDFVDAIMDPYPEEYLVHVYWSQNFRDIVC